MRSALEPAPDRAAAGGAGSLAGVGSGLRRNLGWVRNDPDVRLRLAPFAEELLGLVVRYGARDDHVLARLPLGRSRDLVLGGELERVDDPQHLVEVAAGRHRIDENQLDLLVRP